MLNDAKIGTRISIALAVPLIGLLIFSGLSLVDSNRVENETMDLHVLANLGPTVSGLVHEMQKERGRSAGFISTKGKKFAEELPVQRKQTDAKRQIAVDAIRGFDASGYPADLRQKMDAALAAVADLDAKRQAIDALSLDVPGMAKYYTGTIAKLLAIVEETAVLSTDVRLTNQIVAYTQYLQGKERAGIERAMGANGFGAGAFKPAILDRFVGLIDQQKAFGATFDIYASDAQRAFARETVKGADVDAVARMRKIAVESPQSGNLGDVQADDWFNAITAKINLMKKVEDRLATDIDALATEIHHDALASFYVKLAVTLTFLAVSLALVVVIVRGITGPIAGMTGAMGGLASGDTSIAIAGSGRKDEIGAMAAAVQVFKDNMIKADELAEQQRVDQEIKQKRARIIDDLLSDFNTEVTEALSVVSSASTEMETTSASMSSTAEETSRQAAVVASATEQASANVQTVASAAEELAASVGEINRQVGESNQIAMDARDQAETTNTLVLGLSEAVGKIGEVVNLINDIAEQTNLLALNATIEAARAGDAGKGFAVVASEVKNLANQTAKATDEIAGQITMVQEQTGGAVDAIQNITRIIEKMSEVSASIAGAVEQQGASTNEIARNVQEAAAGTTEVAENVVGVNAAASETGSAASEVLSSAKEVAKRADRLREQVDSFLSNVRAA